MLNESSFFTDKGLGEIKGCSDQLDPIGILNFITQNEFQIRPNWVFREKHNRSGGVCQFIAILEFNTNQICQAAGQNKKEAKIACAKIALCVVAPNMFKQRFPQDADSEKMKEIISQQKQSTVTEQRHNEEQKKLEDEITLGDDRLLQMPHILKPYTPYTYLKQTYCAALYQNKVFTVEETEK